jgi:hypothetical protein
MLKQGCRRGGVPINDQEKDKVPVTAASLTVLNKPKLTQYDTNIKKGPK